MKDHHKILALLGVGAVVVLIILLRKNSGTASNGSAVPDEAVSTPGGNYPNTQPINMGGIEVGGSPTNLTYNYGQPLPTLAIGDNTGGQCGCDDSCEQAGQKVTVQTVNPTALKNAQDNYAGFLSKTQGVINSVGGTPPPLADRGDKGQPVHGTAEKAGASKSAA